MRRLVWCDSTSDVVVPRIRVERFGGRTRQRVHLLGEVKCKKVHHKSGENTMPCYEPDPCPYCDDPQWRQRKEYFGPALAQKSKDHLWVAIIAILTPGAWNKLNACAPGPHRGRLLELWRVTQGTAAGGVLMLKELSRVEPPMPAFDIEPHLLRMWFPDDKSLPVAEIPAAIPYTVEQSRSSAEAEPFVLSEAAKAKLAEMRKQNGIKRSGEEPAPPPPPPPPAEAELELTEQEVIQRAANPKNYAPRVKMEGMVPSADKAIKAATARLKDGEAPDATASDAALGRILGRDGKGGAK